MSRNTSGNLKRRLGLGLLTLYGLGTILGAGIYALVGEVAGQAGLYAPVSFLVAAVIAGFTGYSYAKLSAKYPRSAGEAVYINAAFRWPPLSALVGWLVVATGAVSSATLSRSFVGYLGVFLEVPDPLAIVLVVGIITFIACWGIAESVSVAAVITGFEVLGLLIVLAVAKDELLHFPNQAQALLPPLDGDIWWGIFFGAFIAFYAFIGFEDMVNVAEEVRRPQRNMPIAIFLALGVATVLYILVALVAVLSLPIAELSQSEHPMVTLLEAKGSSLADSIGVISLVAIINGVLIQIVMCARMFYGMGVQGLAPAALSRVWPRTGTPVLATLLAGGIVTLLALAFPLIVLAKLTSFIILLIFILVNLALVVIARREGALSDWPARAAVIASIGGLACLGFLVLQLLGQWR